MAKRAKGLTFDQKREKMLNIFHNTKDVFNFEGLEKLSVKAGIALPSIKEVLQSLKADDLVDCDKIGAGNFYWSFPSRTRQVLLNKIQESKAKIDKLKENRSRLEKELVESEQGREETAQREDLEHILRRKRQQRVVLKKDMEKYERFDPEKVDLIRKLDGEMVWQGNFWTDNLFQIQKYLRKEFMMSAEQIRTRFQIDPQIEQMS